MKTLCKDGPLPFRSANPAYREKVSTGIQTGAKISNNCQRIIYIASFGNFNVQATMDVPSKYLYLVKIFNSRTLRLWIMLNARSLNAEILRHLMLPMSLEVAITRSCDACIHAA